jgi:hypothetical protein
VDLAPPDNSTEDNVLSLLDRLGARQNGKGALRFWPGVLVSDEAIVAVFAHELFELERLRPLLMEGTISIEDFIAHTAPDRPTNLHDQAWEYANGLVERMRKVRAS